MRVIEGREIQAYCQPLLNEYCQTRIRNIKHVRLVEKDRLCYSRNNVINALQERCQAMLSYIVLSTVCARIIWSANYPRTIVSC